jgi:hypothetical protein
MVAQPLPNAHIATKPTDLTSLRAIFQYPIVREIMRSTATCCRSLHVIPDRQNRLSSVTACFNRTYAQHLNDWGTAEGVNPLGLLEIL